MRKYKSTKVDEAELTKIAYIVSNDRVSEVLETNLAAILNGEETVRIVGLYFVDDGVFHIIKGARIANMLRDALRYQDLWIFADDASVKKRNLQKILVEDAEIKSLTEFYKYVQDANHIITI
ncbi:DsrE family protein [candidate division KSB1 bacterium]|nr:DsrE family protein [candidate division KSB1 bacterium]